MSQRCFECEATILPDQLLCEKCNIPQVKEVYELSKRARSAEDRLAFMRNLVAVAAVLSFLGGVILTAVLRPAGESLATDSASETDLAGAVERGEVPAELVNDMFLRTIEQQMHLGLRSWYNRPDGSIVFEMTPPGPGNEAALWESLNDQERLKVMELLSAAYTTMLLRNGLISDLDENSHPVVFLAYYSHNKPLAVRVADGTVRVFASTLAPSATRAQ